MRSNYGYNPMGSQGVGGQYGTQQGNLGRYRPPTMNGNGGWNDSGGYAYNLPNAYGSTGLGYMSGLGNMFSPWQGNMNPQMNYGGGSSFQQMLQQLYQQMSGGQQQQPGMGDGNWFGHSENYRDYHQQQQGNQPPNQSIGRDNRMNPGGGSPRVGGFGSIPRFGRYPESPSMGGGAGTVVPSPVGGVTNQPAPAQGVGANRFWWGGNGG